MSLTEGELDKMWYSTCEAGRLLGWGREKVRRMIHSGEISAYRTGPAGRNFRVPRSEIERLGLPPS